MRILVVFVLALLASGCGKPEPPLAGGKPVDYWVQALKSPDAKLRKTAAFKLGNVGSADPAALPALMTALKDRDPSIRLEVILALVKFGPEAKEASPRLNEMRRNDPVANVRGYAAKALAKIEGEPANAGR